MNIAKSQIHVGMRKIWNVNSSDWFTFNRLLYYLLFRFHLSSFLQLLPPGAFFHFFINESLEVNQAVIKHFYPQASAMQYILGKTMKRTQALEVTSGVSLGTRFYLCAGLSQQRWLFFPCGFSPVQPRHDGDCMEAAAPAADVWAEQTFTSDTIT